MIEIWSKTKLFVAPVDPEDVARFGDVTPSEFVGNLILTTDLFRLVTTDGYTLTAVPG